MSAATGTAMKPLDVLESEARAAGLAPMWRRPGMRGQPESRCAPQSWSYAAIRSLLLRAAPHMSHAECERRVLILENAAMSGTWSMSPTLFAGVQLLLPGEVAPVHRHSQAALRFAFEGNGAHAAIDGERLPIEPGDLLVTPRWAWHDHGHDGQDPALWLDVLDVPLVATLDAEFREWGGDERQQLSSPPGTSEAMFGQGMLPTGGIDAALTDGRYLKRYAYTRSRAAVMQLMSAGELDPWRGVKLQYIDPRSGGAVLPTIAAHLQALPGGMVTRPLKSTETSLLVVTEGEVRASLGGRSYLLGLHDMLLVPSWTELRLEAVRQSFVFSVSNAPLLKAVGLWREAQG
ncbi:MAG: cupin domain-containing protein [Alcaligenaceae bacterium]|nr:cupin domain-containing protein [Alcaligenaceae bacterium SAGV5]MPS51976.1 cupin domain-containing protein [Alcaligenaceae bacterium SAGV3]MPT60543.1 cupin domain-containing protein [Alcaligenaceae bacterium]